MYTCLSICITIFWALKRGHIKLYTQKRKHNTSKWGRIWVSLIFIHFFSINLVRVLSQCHYSQCKLIIQHWQIHIRAFLKANTILHYILGTVPKIYNTIPTALQIQFINIIITSGTAQKYHYTANFKIIWNIQIISMQLRQIWAHVDSFFL